MRGIDGALLCALLSPAVGACHHARPERAHPTPTAGKMEETWPRPCTAP